MVYTKGMLLFYGGLGGLVLLLAAGIVTLTILRKRTKKLRRLIDGETR